MCMWQRKCYLIFYQIFLREQIKWKMSRRKKRHLWSFKFSHFTCDIIYSTSQTFGHTYSFQGFSLFFYYILHCRIVVKTSKLYINYIFEIFQSSHPWWQLFTLLAFSQPASPGMRFQQSCWALVGCFSFTLWSNSPQTISIGLRSGDCGGQVTWCSSPPLSFLVK